jgi:hypothetical protein
MPINLHNSSDQTPTSTDLRSLHSRLPKSLQRSCGEVHIPEDGGSKLLQHIFTHNKPLLGVSDASLKDGQGAHAWILSTGELDHVDDPLMHISGKGPVDGYQADMSSARGEIQGQVALAIMTKLLLHSQQSPTTKVIFHGDNIGVQRKCSTCTTRRLRDHRQPNQDLYLEYHSASKNLSKKVEWVKGHQDKGQDWTTIKDLKPLNLSPAAYLNIWCDRHADEARKTHVAFPDGDVLPAEKWALFSCYPVSRKIIGKLDKEVHESMYTEPLLEYIHKNTVYVKRH